MSIFKRKKAEVNIVEVSHFDSYRDAKEYFEGKYDFIGDQLVKLCAETGLLKVSAKVETGEWFILANYRGTEYKKRGSITVEATAKRWKVSVI